jgi:hypothetical protein
MHGVLGLMHALVQSSWSGYVPSGGLNVGVRLAISRPDATAWGWLEDPQCRRFPIAIDSKPCVDDALGRKRMTLKRVVYGMQRQLSKPEAIILFGTYAKTASDRLGLGGGRARTTHKRRVFARGGHNSTPTSGSPSPRYQSSAN